MQVDTELDIHSTVQFVYMKREKRILQRRLCGRSVRARRTCTEEISYKSNIVAMEQRFRERGYPQWTLDRAKNIVSQIDRKSLLSSKQISKRKFNNINKRKIVRTTVFGESFSLFSCTRTEELYVQCGRPVPQFYRYLMAFIFAIDEINKNPDILPNVTLGYHVYDSCNNVNNAIDNALQILSGPGDKVPNYFCAKFGHLVGVIGDMNPDITLNLAQILKNKSSLSMQFSCIIQYLRRVRFTDPNGEDVRFNEKGEMFTIYHILNYASPTNSALVISCVGHFNVSSQEGKQLEIYNGRIHWKHSDIPVSTCSEQCPPGYKRTIKPGIHKCCFVCLECSEGEISNKTDSVSCHKCPDDQWPNDQNQQCVPKPIELLSYKNDSAVLTVSIISILCFFKTSIILGIFILFRDTPVVRANNQTLSFILLASIMLSFLCVFLFLGRPTHVSCMLRQTSFGILFSVAISSILAKTILVYMAFKATKPGSTWRKFIGERLTNGVVFFCSFLQVLLSIIWLSTSPPFPEMNTHLYQDKVIFQCNEGSMLAFSILLGYMGLLAAVSFIVAFLARNLPDSFNETKNITFSMLVVCSVWVAFIPAYMSVTGKNTVLVEIFAIISSSVGILVCIFFPKCYIILVRPDLNSKSNLSRKIKANTINYLPPSESLPSLERLQVDDEGASSDDSSSDTSRPIFHRDKTHKLLRSIRSWNQDAEGDASASTSDRRSTFQVDASMVGLMEREWKQPEKAYITSRAFKSVYPINPSQLDQWGPPPKVDLAVSKLSRRTVIPLEDSSNLQDLLDS
ncbi:vomeronasal type-2 receptor 26-like [Leptodactylus fuscus]